MQQVQTDVLQLAGNLLLKHKARSSPPRLQQNVRLRARGGSGDITNLAYFLEVELR